VRKGDKIGDKTFKVCLDSIQPAAAPVRESRISARARASLLERRWRLHGHAHGTHKIVFAAQRSASIGLWREPLSVPRIPKFFDLRAHSLERGEESFKYNDWST
jgi:hypothetical protein